MAAVATERMHGHPIYYSHGDRDLERGRRGSRRGSEASRNTNLQDRKPEELPRAASYTYLPHPDRYANNDIVEWKGFPFPEPSEPASSHVPTPATYTAGLNTPNEYAAKRPAPQAKEVASKLGTPSSTLKRACDGDSTRTSMESAARQSGTSLESARTVSTVATTPGSSQHRPSLVSKKSFSRRFSGTPSGVSAVSTPSTPSRSPSPPKQDAQARGGSVSTISEEPNTPKSERRKSFISRTLTVRARSKERKPIQPSGDEQDTEKPVKRRSAFLRKKSNRTSAILAKVTANDVRASALPTDAENVVPAMPALPKSFSTDRLPVTTSSLVLDRAAPIPRLLSSEKVHQPSPLSGTARKKDDLWSIFRSLDGDYSKFSSKTTSLKANVVRTSLIPFLRTYANHPSNKTLRAEDLDRRVNILNKWWTGLIELLHGRNNQSISGTDRPAILDGVSGIMERPEWRLSPSPFCPLVERAKFSMSTSNRSNTSLGSSQSDFLTDSVHHNVRNIFVQNLSSQMAFVVDKMSLRNASASLVTFCGKACAYAFVFVPGMAEVLVRLWELPMETLRRVLAENDIGKFEQMTDFGKDITANFPPALHQLGFTSLTKYTRKLRTSPQIPLGTQHVDWWGDWVKRWNGRESDLFYVFTKHFHLLATDFLHSDSTKKERMCAPGMLLVHAQLLANLDATIHRDADKSLQDSSEIAPTFDEMLVDSDAIALSLPIPPTNAIRLMAENRLIMLIRDFLSERTADHPIARAIFAQSFNDLMQAAARGISMFNHSACYTLLDFMEEAVVILIRYEQLKDVDGPLLNADFWRSVCKKMIDSDNTMTEIRLYSFLFTVWNMLGTDYDRKTNLCVDLILEPDVFQSRFNHWCPMVRAYFMRLLCWRLGRHDGEDHDADLHMLETLQERLQDTWSHYLWLRNKAEREQSILPATMPCNPAPSRRLLIVRTDNEVTTGGSFLTFDGLLRDASMQKPAWRRTSEAAALLDGADIRPGSSSSNGFDSDTESPKGIGGFFRRLLGTKGRSKSREPLKEAVKPALAGHLISEKPVIERTATDGPNGARQQTPTDAQSKLSQQFRALSFKFSLEFHPGNKQLPPMRLFPPRLPPPAQNFLQTYSTKSLSAADAMRLVEPRGLSANYARYSGRALAEWTICVNECSGFFDRRKKEGAPSNKHVETPSLGVEVFKRPS